MIKPEGSSWYLVSKQIISPLFIPNAFSPNNDNENDVLFVRGTLIKDMTFRIYDRWGEMVYSSTEADFCWDGKYKGSTLDPAVFVYYLKQYIYLYYVFLMILLLKNFYYK